MCMKCSEPKTFEYVDERGCTHQVLVTKHYDEEDDYDFSEDDEYSVRGTEAQLLEEMKLFNAEQALIDGVMEKIAELKRNGSVRIPISDFYDTRQRNHKLMKGCYIEICKTA